MNQHPVLLFCGDILIRSYPVFPAECDPGYFCTLRAETATPTDGTTGDVCPEGAYCPMGTAVPIPCPDGWYMNHTQAEVCDVCPPR